MSWFLSGISFKICNRFSLVIINHEKISLVHKNNNLRDLWLVRISAFLVMSICFFVLDTHPFSSTSINLPSQLHPTYISRNPTKLVIQFLWFSSRYSSITNKPTTPMSTKNWMMYVIISELVFFSWPFSVALVVHQAPTSPHHLRWIRQILRIIPLVSKPV